jgi:hypothetical protein
MCNLRRQDKLLVPSVTIVTHPTPRTLRDTGGEEQLLVEGRLWRNLSTTTVQLKKIIEISHHQGFEPN